MRAFQIADFGETPKLVAKEIPEPQPGEVQVAIKACGLNHADLLMIEGRYQEKPQLPITLGMEIAGTVTKLGTGVDSFKVGDRVAAVPGSGGLADMTCIPADRCVALPTSITDIEAAAFQIAYGTSHLALSHRADLRKGETLLVLGAAGGVGLTAVELGAKMGARVIACARGADKLEVAKAAGAHDLLDSDAPDLRGRLKAMGGVDVVYDAVGDPLFTDAMKACKPGARILIIGFAAGKVPQIPANYLLVKNITVHGLYWGGYLGFDPKALTASLSTLLDMHSAGELHPHVSHSLPLEDAAKGLALLRDRKSTGKVIITP